MSAGYTLGPWEADAPHRSGFWVFPKDRGAIYGWSIRAGRETICSQTADDITLHNNEANARLIAAAPDMFEALERLVSDRGDYDDKGNLAAASEQDRDIAQAMAALAKARGDAQSGDSPCQEV